MPLMTGESSNIFRCLPALREEDGNIVEREKEKEKMMKENPILQSRHLKGLCCKPESSTTSAKEVPLIFTRPF